MEQLENATGVPTQKLNLQLEESVMEQVLDAKPDGWVYDGTKPYFQMYTVVDAFDNQHTFEDTSTGELKKYAGWGCAEHNSKNQQRVLTPTLFCQFASYKNKLRWEWAKDYGPEHAIIIDSNLSNKEQLVAMNDLVNKYAVFQIIGKAYNSQGNFPGYVYAIAPVVDED